MVMNGLDQGNPFSGICYLLYNADLLKIPNSRTGELILLFVNDVTIVVTSKDFMEMHAKLQDIMN
jgi:hypothetical protein